MTNILDLTPQQLRQAAKLTERVQKLQKELNGILGESVVEVENPAKQKRKMSAGAKAKMSAAAKKRWARAKAAGKTKL